MNPNAQYRSPVTVKNTTATPFLAAMQVLSYHWSRANGDDATSAINRKETKFPADLAPGQTVTLDALIQAPTLADLGNEREQFTLRWDVYNTATRTWLSDTAQVATLNQPVTVENPTSDQLGLESFYNYSAVATGSGSRMLVNQYSGNAVWTYNPFTDPGRGPSSFTRLSYNSKDTSNAYGGPGWSVSPSTLNRLGTPLSFTTVIGNIYATEVTLTDGDGTSHRWELNTHNSADTATWTYDSPAGVNLYLQFLPNNPDDRKWLFTAPERTQFFFDVDGYQTATVDKNGNTLSFAYDRVPVANRNTGLLRSVTDATGRRTLTFDYYQTGQPAAVLVNNARVNTASLASAVIVNQLKSITDVSGRQLLFVYTDGGKLGEIDDAAGTPDQKTFQFFYASDGLNAGKLVQAVDPNGNSTKVSYYSELLDLLRLGNVATVNDRRGFATGFQYADADGTAGNEVNSTVTDGNGNASRYRLDGFGRMTSQTDALNRTTKLVWDADNNVVRLTENNGAVKTWSYDPKTGFPLEIRDAEANRQNYAPTTLAYRTTLDGHIADLTDKTTPEGRHWVFGYDDKGNLTSVVDPKGTATPDANDYTSRYTYDQFGQLTNQTDANNHTTVYAEYDQTGRPNLVTDALGCQTRYRYDVVGMPTVTRDARGKTGYSNYDVFHRPLDSKLPKDEAAGAFIVTAGARYDGNDNVVSMTDARGSVTKTTFDEMDQPIAVFAPKDTPTIKTDKLTTTAYDAVGNVVAVTQPKGNNTPGDGNDFTERTRYDEVNQRIEVIDTNGDRVSMAYDDVGNLVTKIDARSNKTSSPDDYANKWQFDQNHQVIAVLDPAGNAVKTRYDKDGNVVGSIDEDGVETVTVLDERAKKVETRSPHDMGRVFTTRYEYDQVGNQTRTVNPRGTETAEANDFVQETTYDELNRKREEILPYAPSRGSDKRTVTNQAYFDNGWVRSSADPYDITTTYDYNETGQQTLRRVTGSGGSNDASSARTQSWTYYPSGKQKSHSDSGVPVGAASVLVDNGDPRRAFADDGFRTRQSPKGYQGPDYSEITTTQEGDYFVWKPTIPTSGTYDVQVWYPAGTATNATYYVVTPSGTKTVVIDQSKNQGTWVSLGKFGFTGGETRDIALDGQSNGTVAADAVKLVRDTSKDPDTESKTFQMKYDANDNMTQMTDSSSSAVADTWDLHYDEVNLNDKVTESKSGSVLHTTDYDYDSNDNMIATVMDDKSSAFTYDNRDLVTSIVNKRNAGDPGKTTTFTYDKQAHVIKQVKGNGNTLDASYYLDGLLKRQTEKKKNSASIVADHQITYDANSNKTRDTGVLASAEGGGAMNSTKDYTYDPRDRVRKVTKTGQGAGSESYRNDDNGNVYDQTVAGVQTSFVFDRNRLRSSTSAGATSDYDYDPYGRLRQVTQSGKALETYGYDGFDRRVKLVKQSASGTPPSRTTLYTYDPLDRQTSKTEDATGTKRVTGMNYLGLSKQVLTETVNTKLSKIYQYTADGEMLSQVRFGDDGNSPAEDVFLGFNTHSDVEQVTDKDGNTKATYGYTAYGEEDLKQSTGDDKTDPADPTNPAKPEKNSYRFNTTRHDKAANTYDMGFRDYSPSTNRFLTLDLYNGALSDLGMSADPWTSNRYTFGAGNPLSQVELDGHGWFGDALSGAASFVAAHSDVIHTVLTVASVVPGVGAAASVINAGLYTAEGKYGDAALALAGAIPGAAAIAGAVKLGKAAVKGAEAVAGATKVGRALQGSPKIAGQVVQAGVNKAKGAVAPALPGAKSAGAKAGGQAEKTGLSSADNTAASCTANSFAPGTLVLLADGTTKPIEDVQVGDQVAATDPSIDSLQAEPVEALITGEGDKNLVDITIDTDGNPTTTDDTATVVATDGHPFWIDDRGQWVDATHLQTGDLLHQPDGTTATVTHLNRHTTHHQTVHNLTIHGLHTYYILAGNTPLLTHNCVDDLYQRATAPLNGKAGDTAASRAYQKHMGRPDATLIPLNSGKERVEMSEYLVQDLLTNPKTAIQRFTNKEGRSVTHRLLSDLGAQWDSKTGEFIGFLDKPNFRVK